MGDGEESVRVSGFGVGRWSVVRGKPERLGFPSRKASLKRCSLKQVPLSPLFVVTLCRLGGGGCSVVRGNPERLGFPSRKASLKRCLLKQVPLSHLFVGTLCRLGGGVGVQCSEGDLDASHAIDVAHPPRKSRLADQ